MAAADDEKRLQEQGQTRAFDPTLDCVRDEITGDAPESGRRFAERFVSNKRFELVREIGAGGMGVVFEAIDLQQDTRIALKTMQRLLPAELYRFKKEFRSLANIVHPNLVRLHELFSDGREWYYTMEFVDGVDFLTWVRRTEPEAADSSAKTAGFVQQDTDTYFRLRQALIQLVDGVDALHSQGKLHRDIKPSNILVTPEGRVLLLDFGLVKDVGDDSRSDRLSSEAVGGEYNTQSIATDGNIAGTIRYMAPEQAAGEALTDACDWYAVGVILFQSLTGKYPFTGVNSQVLEAKQRDDPPHPSALTADLPSDLAEICQTLLARDPVVRLQGVKGLKQLRSETQTADGDARLDDVRLPFIGRDHYLDALHKMFERVAGGRALMVHLHGRSGAGKSALANRFLVNLGQVDGCVVLAGRCYEQESVPYKALDSLVDSLSRYLLTLPTDVVADLMPPDIAALGRIFPVLERVKAVLRAAPRDVADPFKLRRAAFESLAELLRRLGSRHRLVVYIDDLQWGDGDSAVFIRELIKSKFPPRMLFVASYRSEYRSRSPCLTALPEFDSLESGRVAIEELEIGPLSTDEAVRLSRALLNEKGSPADAQRIALESGGNPYFVYELANLTNFEISREGSRTEISQLDLDHALWARVQRLPETPRRLLETLAVSGRPIPLRNLYEAAGVNPSGQPGIALLRAGHLIRRAGPSLDDDVESFHDRIRESIVAHLERPLLATYHLGLARSLDQSGRSDLETIAIHYHAAGEIELAGGFYEQAAEMAASALAFDRAAKLYRETLAVHKLDVEKVRELRIKLADALGNAGRGAESAGTYLSAAEGLRGEEAFRLRERAGYQYCVAGHIDEGRECFRGVLNHLGLQLPATRKAALFSLIRRRLLLMIRGTRFRRRVETEIADAQLNRIDLSWAVAGGITVIDPIPAADFQTHNLLLALQAGEPFRVARALAWEASHVAMIGQRLRPRVERLLDEATRLANEINEPMALGTVDLARSVAAFFLGDFLNCRTYGDKSARLFREKCIGARWELDQSQVFAYWACYFLGDLSELAERQKSLLAAARERGATLTESQLSTFGGPFVWLAQDDPQRAKAALADATQHWNNVEYQVYHYTALTAKTQIALYEGRGDEALEMMNAEWSQVAGALLLHVELVRAYMRFLRARCALASVSQSKRSLHLLATVRRDARKLARMRPEWARAAAHQINAALAFRAGNMRKAIQELDQAIAGFDQEHFALHAWCGRYVRGTLISGPKGPVETEAAVAWMQDQGIQDPRAMVRVNAPGFEQPDNLAI